MNKPVFSCPDCNAALPYRPRIRDVPGSTVIVQSYIVCDKCKHLHVLAHTTRDVHRIEKELRMMETKLTARLAEGKSIRSLQRAIGHKRHKMTLLRREAGLDSERGAA